MVLMSVSLTTSSAFSQTPITGQTCVTSGTSYLYTFAGSYTSSTTMSWSTTGGATIAGSSSGTFLLQIPVTFSGSGSVKVITSNPSSSATLNVSFYSGLFAGTISNTSQTINYNTLPAAINCSGATVTGCTAPNFSYQWQSGTDSVSFSDISNATAPNLSFSNALTTTSYYRRFVKENTTNKTAYSLAAKVIVNPPANVQPLIPGSITPSNQYINYNTNSVQLSSSGVSGGTGVYSYQWQSATDNVTWNNVSSTLSTYTPVNQTLTNYFRVAVTSYLNTAYSSSAMVNVYPPVATGTVTPGSITITPGGNPGMISATASTGGNGTYTYQWQSSADGINFNNIGGATITYYAPGTLNTNTWYRLMAASNGIYAYSNIVPVSLNNTLPDINTVRVREILTAEVKDIAAAEALTSPYDVSQVSQYYDGIGRPLQTVAMQQSPLQKDIVSFNVYDAFGREMFKYLPYTASTADGNYKPTFQSDQYSFNSIQYPGEQFYYGQTIFEQSPLNRATTTYSPGLSWAGSLRGLAVQYLVNTDADSVRLWNIGIASGSIPATTATYPAGTLNKVITTDETGNAVVEYRDMEGHVVLKKAQFTATPGIAHVGWLCTYYIYDILDNLRFVLQPKATEISNSLSWNLTQPLADELCFRYEYDSRNRMIIKKVPGAGEVYMVYDKRDRLVFTQNANMRLQDKWLYSLYDQLNRPIQTGIIVYAGFAALQNYANGSTIATPATSVLGSNVDATIASLILAHRETGVPSYTASSDIQFTDGFVSEDNANFTAEIVAASSSSFISPVAINLNPVPAGVTLTPLTCTFYDNYDWTTTKNYSTTDNNKVSPGTNSHAEALPTVANIWVKNQVTGTRIRIVEDPANLSAGKWLENVSFYDDKQRPVQLQSVNVTGGRDITTSLYDFSGKPLSTYISHQKLGGTAQNYSVASRNTYDAGGRLTNTEKNLNNNGTWKTLSAMDYNELGQLKNKKLGTDPVITSNPLETLTYDYNIRGWLLGINRDYAKTVNSTSNFFGFDLGYDKTNIKPASGSSIGGFTSAAYNGNIAGMMWKSKGDGQVRKYDFTYNAVNWLTAANFKQYSVANSVFDLSDKVDYTVNNLQYDADGNILSQDQNGLILNSSSTIDILTYTYINNSNRLQNVIDGANNTTTKLGDFRSSSAYMAALGTKVVANAANYTDYSYDGNGNLTIDNNKDITAIIYNHLNLPQTISISGKGTIQYLYDATGNKLKKIVQETGKADKTTLYLFGTYQDEILQFLPQEEGRIRKKDDGTFAYDYFLKDHLGNVRTVLTEEQKTDPYPVASLETSSIN